MSAPPLSLSFPAVYSPLQFWDYKTVSILLWDEDTQLRATTSPQVFQGVLERDMKNKLFLTGKVGTKLDILVENMGRLSFGSNCSDFKVSKHFCLPDLHVPIAHTPQMGSS